MNSSNYRTGFRAACLAFLFTNIFTLVQTLQLAGVLHYPWDEILIYGSSLCITVPFIFQMLALHYTAPADKKLWSHAALIFTGIYAVFVIANYVVQLATVIPATLEGRADSIRLFMQTPHSLFWDFDAIGYIAMGLAVLSASPVFDSSREEKRVRLSFRIHGLLITPLIAFVYFYPYYSGKLLLLAIPWSVTAPVSMLMAAGYFRRKLKNARA